MKVIEIYLLMMINCKSCLIVANQFILYNSVISFPPDRSTLVRLIVALFNSVQFRHTGYTLLQLWIWSLHSKCLTDILPDEPLLAGWQLLP